MQSEPPSAASIGSSNQGWTHEDGRFGPAAMLANLATGGNRGYLAQPQNSCDITSCPSCLSQDPSGAVTTPLHPSAPGSDRSQDSDRQSLASDSCQDESQPETWEQFVEERREFIDAPLDQLPSQDCRNILGYIFTIEKGRKGWAGSIEVTKAYNLCLEKHMDIRRAIWDLHEAWGHGFSDKEDGIAMLKDYYSRIETVWHTEIGEKNQDWLEGVPPENGREARLKMYKNSLETVAKRLDEEASNIRKLLSLQ
jgi:hypothetical protein